MSKNVPRRFLDRRKPRSQPPPYNGLTPHSFAVPGPSPAGWNDLPTELHLQILSYATLSKGPVFAVHHERCFNKHLLPMLRVNHSFGVAQEAYYKTNIFELEARNGIVKLPNPALRGFIRHIQIGIHMDECNISAIPHGEAPNFRACTRCGWAVLGRFMAGEFGLKRIRSLTLEVHVDRSQRLNERFEAWVAFRNFLATQPANIVVPGVETIEVKGTALWPSAEWSGMDIFRDEELEKMVGDWIVPGGRA
ncbi:hypothetical protein BS50DRAFT_586888 [Corynespora cassiicola Philippines]|uniref:Uncharacterized protein n=1 Tax=Corynespora cassiicola Philippines TaxID=1448308 RepID=A0A2T2NQA6_CORCC|nr:hypothetical protein BS50DRAFT_586888 [Corynespora cassiicola Philippines]